MAEDTTKAALAYVLTWLTGLVVYLIADEKDKYTRFHALQSILFGISMVVIMLVWMVIAGILTFALANVSGSLLIIPGLLTLLVYLGFLVLWVLLIVKAYQGEKYKLPVIGDFADKKA